MTNTSELIKIAPNPINVVYPIYQRFIRPPIPIIRFMIILIIIYMYLFT